MSLAWVAGFGVFVTETLTVLGLQPDATPKQVSRTKMSLNPPAVSLSPGTRFEASEANATNLPSALIPRLPLLLFPAEPSFPNETRLVVGAQPEEAPLQAARPETVPVPPTLV